MRTANQLLILSVTTIILSVPALAKDAPSLPEDLSRPLIGRPFPQLTGIKALYLYIEMPESEAKIHNAAWKELKHNVESKLDPAGIILIPQAYNSHQITSPFLRVNVDIFTLKDSRQSVFRVQTSLSRAVYLTPGLSWAIQADVWQSVAVMQGALTENMPAEVTKVTLEQVDTFIADYRAANPPGAKSPDVNDITAVVPVVTSKQTKPVVKPTTAKYTYVASKNSKVFHKSDCRWIQRIKSTNLVTYSTRDKAIQSGKRSCKTCNP
ncbi:MAG: hypothetical protein ACYSUY_03200 [Planctomycetota bacterium]